MSCTRVLHAVGSRPPSMVSPVDLAACLSLGQRQPLRPLLSPLRPTQRLCPPRAYSPQRHPSTSTLPPSPTSPRSCFRKHGCGLKKRVVFADAKGMALTAVRLFIPEPTSPTSYSPLPSTVLRRIVTKLEAPNKSHKLRLAFTQPSLDFKVFLSRQKEVGVQLESCTVSESCLSGKVRVSNVGAEQTVHVRVSFDSWKSHHDIPCTFLQQQWYGVLSTDIFTFDLSLPLNLDPADGIEFCVLSRGEGNVVPMWDDNRGQNYRIHVEDSISEPADTVLGSTMLSKYRQPLSPSPISPVEVRSLAEMPHLRSLTRVVTEWRPMCPVK